MTCANEKCRKLFTPKKPWAKFFSRICGTLVRMRRYYRRKVAPAKIKTFSVKIVQTGIPRCCTSEFSSKVREEIRQLGKLSGVGGWRPKEKKSRFGEFAVVRGGR